jgi:hypothetical protein
VQQSKQDERLAAIEARQEHELMRKVMRRVLHCKHWAGFNRLHQNVADCKQMERLMRKVLQRAKNLKLAMGFNRLQYNIRHHKDKRLLRVTVVRWCRIRLLHAFRTLAHQVVMQPLEAHSFVALVLVSPKSLHPALCTYPLAITLH